MPRRSARKPPSRSGNQKLPQIDEDSSGLSCQNDTTNQSESSQSTIIKLRPLSALIAEDETSAIGREFAFGENSLSSSSIEFPVSRKVFPEEPQQPPSSTLPLSTPSTAKLTPKKSSKLETPTTTPFATPRRKFQKKLIGNYHKLTDFYTVTPSPRIKLQFPAEKEKENVSDNNNKSPTPIISSSENSQLPVPRLAPETSGIRAAATSLTYVFNKKPCQPTDSPDKLAKNTSMDQKQKFSDYLIGGGEGSSSSAAPRFPVKFSGNFDVALFSRSISEALPDLLIETCWERKELRIDVKEGTNPAAELSILSEIGLIIQSIGGYDVKEISEVSPGGDNKELEIETVASEIISIDSSDSESDKRETTDKTPAKSSKPTTSAKKPTGRRRNAKATPAKTPAKKERVKKQKRQCPSYKLIKGTSFAVDAFCYGEIEGVTNYFLTHFHSDHYQGLNKKFRQPIVMSHVTADLVRNILKVEPEFICPIELGVPMFLNGVEITALDANHCPGAVMFVFKLVDGTCILHVGDFRAIPEMEEEPVFWNNHINCIYLDTTYLTGKHEHPTQSESIDEMIRYVDKYREEHIGVKYVIIVGTYVIGKEKVWSRLANHLGCLVWLEKARRDAVECYGDSSLLQLLEVDPLKALIHVLPLQNMFYEKIVEYLSGFEDSFTHALVVRPSGWEKRTKPQIRGNVTILGIQYSEHSSYSELERFVTHLRPEEVISTVPFGSDRSRTPKIPAKWLTKAVAPKRDTQQSLTNFWKPQRSSSAGVVEVKEEKEDCEDIQEGALNLSMRVSPNRSIPGDEVVLW